MQQVNMECQASSFDQCNYIRACYYVAHEREKLHGQFGQYSFHISSVLYGVTKVFNRQQSVPSHKIPNKQKTVRS